MEQTLKITNVLSDPTRFHIYNYISNNNKEVTVQEIASNFSIHPNVARLHLTKLEDVNMLLSEAKKTGRGGRPSRLYRLSNNVIKLNFPFRDYELLSTIALETMASLGEIGHLALSEVGEKYGAKEVEQRLNQYVKTVNFNADEKLDLLDEVAMKSGFFPSLEKSSNEAVVSLVTHNCPFKEVAENYQQSVCTMHKKYLHGMYKVLFEKVEISEESNLLSGCENCTYKIRIPLN